MLFFSPSLLFILVCAALTGCSSELEPVVVVRIPQVPASVTAIQVQNRLGDRTGKLLTLTPSGPGELRFGVSVAASSRETIHVELTGIADNDCVSATGQSELTLAGLSFPVMLEIPLDPLPLQRCTLSVTVSQSLSTTGSVKSIPAGIDCSAQGGTCTFTFAPSTSATMSLIAETEPDSLFTWMGSCQGSGPCRVALDRKREEKVAFDPRSCLIPDVCYYSPTPRDTGFLALASAGDQAWAVGFRSGGSAAHYVDGRWRTVQIGIDTPMRGLWTDPAGSIVAVGDLGQVVRGASEKFFGVPTGTTSRLMAVWGGDSSELWAVGEGGSVLRIVGTTATRYTSPVDGGPQLNSIWGSSKTDIWAVGSGGTIIRWDGNDWKTFPSPNPSLNYVSVFGSGPQDVWLLGGKQIYRWDGLMWRLSRQEQELVLQGFARSPSDVWVLRNFQRLSVFNGVKWTRDLIPTAAVTTTATIAPSGSDAVWAAGLDGLISRGQNGVWTDASGFTPSMHRAAIRSTWAAAPDDVWACGAFFTLHWNGRVWESLEGVDVIDCNVIFGSAGNDVWMLGTGGVALHYDGTTWSKLPTVAGVTFLGGWAVSNSEAYGVGSGGSMMLWDGMSWSSLSKRTTVTLRSAWGASASDIWVVGDSGSILRGQGVSFALQAKPTSANFLAVGGVGSNDVHLVGDELWHWNGATFAVSPLVLPSAVSLRSVSAASDGSAWAVGDLGTVLRYAKGEWTTATTGLMGTLAGVASVTPTDAWFVGDRQTVLRYHR